MASDTAAVARAYFDAWTTGKGAETMRPLLDEGFRFDAGMHVIEGREVFLAGGGWPEGSTVTMLSEAYDGDEAFQLYEAERAGQRVKIAEHLSVRGGRIVASEIVVDGAALSAFMGAPS
jgi:hypothetical protein